MNEDQVIDYLFGDEVETEEYAMNPDKVRRAKRVANNAKHGGKKGASRFAAAYRKARYAEAKSANRRAIAIALRKGEVDNVNAHYYVDPWDWD